MSFVPLRAKNLGYITSPLRASAAPLGASVGVGLDGLESPSYLRVCAQGHQSGLFGRGWGLCV